MHPFISEDDLAIEQMVSKFAELEIKPHAREIDESGQFIHRHLPHLASLGIMGMNLPQSSGGPGVSPTALYLAIEQLSGACGSTASAVTAHYMATDAIEIGASDALKAKYLPRAASGELLAAYAMTEPRAGSNPADMATRATKTDGGYLLNGVKHFISNGGVADFAVVFCVTDPDAGSRGISAMVLDLPCAGFSASSPEPTMGLKGGHVFELHFDNCFVPQENLIGAEGQGFKISMIGLDGARLDVAAMSTGIAQAALNDATQWAKQRLVAGKPIAQLQGIQWKLADMATDLEAARLLGLNACHQRATGQRYTREATFAKLFSSEMAARVTDQALQIHGGYGYSREMPLERYVRDARITRIFDGSSEIHRNIIARMLLQD